MGPLDVMRHKVEVLRRHCEDVGRDPAEIEFTLGIKATIRDSEAEADRVWKAAMEHNRTPMADVADDDTFWNGTADQLAERLAPYVELGFRTVISEQPAPYDAETFERLIGEVGAEGRRAHGLRPTMAEFLGSARGRLLAVFDTPSRRGRRRSPRSRRSASPPDRIEVFTGDDGAAAFDGSGAQPRPVRSAVSGDPVHARGPGAGLHVLRGGRAARASRALREAEGREADAGDRQASCGPTAATSSTTSGCWRPRSSSAGTAPSRTCRGSCADSRSDFSRQLNRQDASRRSGTPTRGRRGARHARRRPSSRRKRTSAARAGPRSTPSSASCSTDLKSLQRGPAVAAPDNPSHDLGITPAERAQLHARVTVGARRSRTCRRPRARCRQAGAARSRT